MDYEKMMQRTNDKNHFMRHNHIRLTQLSRDRAVTTLAVQPDSRNLYGMLHGGVYFTMADCAAGSAARSRGMRHVTLGNSFEFMRTSKHEQLSAIATVRHRGKTICIVSVDVVDGEGVLLAGGTFTMFATGEPDGD